MKQTIKRGYLLVFIFVNPRLFNTHIHTRTFARTHSSTHIITASRAKNDMRLFVVCFLSQSHTHHHSLGYVQN